MIELCCEAYLYFLDLMITVFQLIAVSLEPKQDLIRIKAQFRSQKLIFDKKYIKKLVGCL